MRAPHRIKMPKDRCGIYHLMRGGRVIYVGQTTNVFSRLGGHFLRLQFDAVEFFPCSVAELSAREEADLARLRPELNRLGVTRPYRVMPGQIAAHRQYAARVAGGAQ